MLYKTLISILILSALGCQSPEPSAEESVPENPISEGKLFIIGGGSRPPAMISTLIDISGIRDSGYGIILPMSSIEPDSSVYYANLQFQDQGIMNVSGMHFTGREDMTASRVDSVQKASLIYISGGDQNRFMEVVRDTPLERAIHEAYANGAIIAGTSAGAAVMSARMITGNEKKHPDYTNTFQHIQPNNIEISKGLGLLDGVIIDQHFVKRSRYNRLISAILEYPDDLGIGIDESTAILVDGDSARVIGESQVILFKNQGATEIQGELLGSRDIELDVLLPGDSFLLKK